MANLPQGELQLIQNGDKTDPKIRFDGDISSANDLVLFPNPAPQKKNIHLRFNQPQKEKVEVSVFDISGKLVWKKWVSPQHISLPGFNPGMYQILVNGANTFARKRLMVRE